MVLRQPKEPINDAESGEIIVSLNMTDFDFEKKLMQEHFNENYVESHKYPKSIFKGKISSNEVIDYGKNGVYKVEVSGSMTIHGVTRDVKADGTIEVSAPGISASSTFMLNPEDYKIKIPKIVRNNIANSNNTNDETPRKKINILRESASLNVNTDKTYIFFIISPLLHL